MNEQWLPVPDFEDNYEVSNLGRVRSLRRMTKAGWRGGDRVLRIRIDPKTGSVRASLWRDGKGSTVLVSRLVLRAFIGPCPAGMEACHNNGQPHENHLTNLRWDTHANNIADKKAHGTERYGESHYSTRLGDDVIELVFKLREQGWLQREIAHHIGTTQSHVSHILKGQVRSRSCTTLKRRNCKYDLVPASRRRASTSENAETA